MEMLDKGVIHILGGAELDGVGFHHTTQNGEQFETEESFISGRPYLIFLDCSGLQGTETAGSRTLGQWVTTAL